MYIYVASSWRNTHQPQVVAVLRHMGHDVYDFKDSDGFRWSEIDEGWQSWDPVTYIRNLDAQPAVRGFTRDMAAMERSHLFVYVMPCGPSASMEAGWAKGRGLPVVAYVPEMREPDLMIKMFDLITPSLGEVTKFVNLRAFQLSKREVAK